MTADRAPRTRATALARDPLREVDVLVVGGGPAGSLAAEAAARQGLRTLLVEREAEIGHPVRTSGALALATATQFGIPERHYHPLRTVRLASPGETAVFRASEPVACVIDVRETYRHLARRAEAAGARVLTRAEAIHPIIVDGAVTGCAVRYADRVTDVRARVVIDASGHRASVSRAAALHPGFARFGVGAELEVVSDACRQDELVLIVGTRHAPAGYAWVFPWGDGRVRLGVGLLHADTREDPRRLLSLFVAELDRFEIELGHHEITERHHGLIPAGGLASRLAGAGIVAVGDAAGVATLVVGEGIRLGMVSGLMAGEAAARAIVTGRGDAVLADAYERPFRQRFEGDLRIGEIINRRIARWTDAKWDACVRTLRDLPADVLVEFLHSHLSPRAIAMWVATRPRAWPRIARWVAKGTLDVLRHGRTA
jgi:digeranylgeranylglycerophospholipid reductase